MAISGDRTEIFYRNKCGNNKKSNSTEKFDIGEKGNTKDYRKRIEMELFNERIFMLNLRGYQNIETITHLCRSIYQRKR